MNHNCTEGDALTLSQTYLCAIVKFLSAQFLTLIRQIIQYANDKGFIAY